MRPVFADRRLRPRFPIDRRPNDTLTSGRRCCHCGHRNRFRPFRLRIGYQVRADHLEGDDQRSSIGHNQQSRAGSNKTIVDYIKENGIVEAPVHRGDPGSPTIDLPFPPGWEDAGNRTPEWAYGAIVFSDPAMAQDPPTIIALVSKLTGNVDPAKVLEFAAGEIKNLPGYEGATEGSPSTLSGFDATQIGGTYTKDGVKRAIAQKTVVIPGQDGLYVLQLNADGTEEQMPQLMDATTAIDEQTTITL
jgi:hypothetical protein